MVTIKIDHETAQEWWEAAYEAAYEIRSWAEKLPDWHDGPAYAKNPLIFD